MPIIIAFMKQHWLSIALILGVIIAIYTVYLNKDKLRLNKH
jgi:type II secretory pathway component PulF